MFRVIAFLFLLSLSLNSAAQGVVNNDIEKRIVLKLDSLPLHSSTEQSDVQWNCIDKHLTHKCLIYHNDQWFSFTALNAGPAYLNIRQQQCRDMLGVQVVVIEGDPCQTSTYKLRKCIDFTDQADFFVMLDSLTSGQEYLINIDGYLGDVCEFEIELNSAPNGVPIHSPRLPGAEVVPFQKDSIVTLAWTISDSLLTDGISFLIFRRKNGERRSREISTPLIRNTLGTATGTYSITDTLRTKGDYVYSIFLERLDGVFLVDKTDISYQTVHKTPPYFLTKRTIEYFSRENGSVQVKVLSEDKKVLYSFRHKSVKGRNTFSLDFSPYLEMGQRKFIVTLKNKFMDEGRSVSF
jgi:hypothetical protein